MSPTPSRPTTLSSQSQTISTATPADTLTPPPEETVPPISPSLSDSGVSDGSSDGGDRRKRSMAPSPSQSIERSEGDENEGGRADKEMHVAAEDEAEEDSTET